jgi:aspartate/glutamate racemase
MANANYHKSTISNSNITKILLKTKSRTKITNLIWENVEKGNFTNRKMEKR